MVLEKTRRVGRETRRYLITGILTVIPLWITWWVFNFILSQLANVGMPAVRTTGRVLEPALPTLGQWLMHPAIQFILAVALTLAVLWTLGWLASNVLGKQLLAWFERLMHRIPLVERIYGTTRKLLTALQKEPDSLQRVVLIPFPSPEMKTIGFVTRIFRDADNDQEYAAVYVPTTPNPTSGYMEIVPLENLVSTDWSVDQAMSFIISGGTVGPDVLHYSRSVGGHVGNAPPASPDKHR